MLNSDSRRRSAVGRIDLVFGAASARPRKRPPTTRIIFRRAAGAAVDRRRDRANDDGSARAKICLDACRAALCSLLHAVLEPAVFRSVRRRWDGLCGPPPVRRAFVRPEPHAPLERAVRRETCAAASWSAGPPHVYARRAPATFGH